MTWNVAYHLKEIYLSAEIVLEKFKLGFNGQDSDHWYTVGRQTGRMFYWTFYDVQDFTYPDIELTYQEDFDESLEFF